MKKEILIGAITTSLLTWCGGGSSSDDTQSPKEEKTEKQLDKTAPVLSSKNKTFTTTVGKSLVLETISANDDKDGIVDVIKTGNVDFNTIGTYKIVYSASDTAGNTSKITHTYIVQEVKTSPKPHPEKPVEKINHAPTKPTIVWLTDITLWEKINPTCSASDEDNNNLTYTYFVDDVEVNLPYEVTTIWTKTFKCVVSDKKEEVSSEQTFEVKEKEVEIVDNKTTITPPTLKSVTSDSISLNLGKFEDADWVNLVQVVLYSDSALTQEVSKNTDGNFEGLNPDTTYYAIMQGEAMNKKTNNYEVKKSKALKVKTNEVIPSASWMAISDQEIDDTFNESTDVLVLENINSYLQNTNNTNIVLSGNNMFSIKNENIIYNGGDIYWDKLFTLTLTDTISWKSVSFKVKVNSVV